MSEQSIAITTPQSNHLRWWLMTGLILLLLIANFFEGMQRMVADWLSNEEYSHGILLPVLSAYLIWRRRDELDEYLGRGHWSGVVLIAICLAINIIAKFASVFALQQYSLVFVIYGLVLCYGGWSLFRKILAPLLLLLLMVPLPNFFMNNISAELQLISSRLGVMFIRMANISVFLEGNVIDLGTYKLQVAEACSGLRYLFPLMTMGFVMAYLFHTSWWKRLFVFVSSVPLTIFMNSLRIGVIGVLVDHWGIGMAEGFLHQFQGWVVFMASTAILLLEVIVLARLGGGGSWREQFGFHDRPAATTKVVSRQSSGLNKALLFGTLLLAVSAPAVYAIPKETEVIPHREYFNTFPLQISDWQGKRGQLEQVYLDGLMMDDYFIADFVATMPQPINFYVAWYDTQQAGRSAHSPRSCLPGGGWHIKTIERVAVRGMDVNGEPLNVNRVLIEYGGQQQLVYYWFQQRGHIITNEYMVKWYLFWDSLTRHRSDGALVRVTVPIPEGASVAAAETQLTSFIKAAVPKLTPYIPG